MMEVIQSVEFVPKTKSLNLKETQKKMVLLHFVHCHPRTKEYRFGNNPKEDGIVPVNLLIVKYKTVNLVINPVENRRDPLN
jgi:hypothetical protein